MFFQRLSSRTRHPQWGCSVAKMTLRRDWSSLEFPTEDISSETKSFGENILRGEWGKREHLRENLNKTVKFDHRVSFIV